MVARFIKVVPMLLGLLLSVSLRAQTLWAVEALPFMPLRDSTHLSCVTEYEPSTVVMGARSLRDIRHYDRQGYLYDETAKNRYDDFDRLVGRIRTYRYWDDMLQDVRCDTTERLHIDYTDEGLVGRFRTISCHRSSAGFDSIIEDISLVQFDYDEVLGITRCVYSKEVTSFAAFAHYRAHPAGYSEDTLILERQFDTLGRLLREAYRGGAEALGDYEKLYGYDDSGRILYEIRKDDLGRDSLGYRYNSLGNLIEKSGKSWNLEQESDITIIYRPDGSPMEKTTIFYEEDWDYGANPENRIIERIYYDKHGNITRKEAENAREYDNEYW